MRAGPAGDVLLPTQDRYDRARRVWNGMADRRPAAIGPKVIDRMNEAIATAPTAGSDIYARNAAVPSATWPRMAMPAMTSRAPPMAPPGTEDSRR